jgi:F-type H+-transporting ATPase subunit b
MQDLLQNSTVWVLFSFIIFVVVAYRLGRTSVTAGLDAKIEKIKNDILSAEKLKSEAETLLKDYQNKQRDAALEARKIIEQAETQAGFIQSQAEASLNETMKRREALLKERISRMETQAIDEIRRYAADLTINATTQIISQKLDSSSSQKLADHSIQETVRFASKP